MIKRNAGIFLVLFIALLIYLPSLHYHFVGDDYIALAKISAKNSLRGVFSFLWPSGPNSAYLRPLQWLPYMLGFKLTGLPVPPDPLWQTGSFLPAYHFLSLVLHLANIALIYLIARSVLKSRPYACFSALIFAVHPITPETVCWIACFGDLAFTFFALLTVVFFAKSCLETRQMNARSVRYARSARLYYWASLISFALSLCSKESALVLPVLIILTAAFLKQEKGAFNIDKKRQEASGYFFVAALYIVLRLIVLPFKGLPQDGQFFNVPGKLLKLVHYLRDLFLPLNLDKLKQFVYFHNLLIPLSVIAIILLGVSIYILVLGRKDARILRFCLLWIALTLIIPVMAPFAPMRRHLYFPLCGLSILLPNLASFVKKKNMGILFLLCFAFFSVQASLSRNSLYRFSGKVVQEGLSELKTELPEVKPESKIYLVGIPSTIKNTPAFFAAPEAKIKFLYRNYDLDVTCLSGITFTRGGLKRSDIVFFDKYTLQQSLHSGLEEFIRVGTQDYSYNYKIIKQDKFGNIEKILFHLNTKSFINKDVYLIVGEPGGLKVLRHSELNG